jgi:predicted TIM-barrel fold metal-dependent hydrolase
MTAALSATTPAESAGELLPFVDTHVHLWDSKRTTLRYDWLAENGSGSPLGDLDGLRTARFSVPELRAESRLQHVTKIVHMDAAAGTPDPVEETAWLQELGDATGWPDAVIASCDLAADDAARQVERHLEHGRLRGFRDMRPAAILDDDAFRRGYALLGAHGLVFCHQVGWADWTRARDLARAFPQTTFCLDQSGMPEQRDAEYLDARRGALLELGREPNVVCKISSLGMKDPRWTVATRRPWVMGCLDAFGTERCFFGSNWPIERLYSSYSDVVAAFRSIVAELSPAEQAQVLAGNAERIFRI